MIDMPNGSAASYSVLYTGYGSPGVASTIGFVQDGDIRLVTDPGMVRHRSRILDPLRDMGITPEDVTDVVFSHHHPDHTLNAALFPTPGSTIIGRSTAVINGTGATPRATNSRRRSG